MTATPSKSVVVNGEERQLSAKEYLAEFLASMDIMPETRGVAVALNEEVIRKEEWASVTVRPGDRIEVVTAKQGG